MLILASSSPRRKSILEELGVSYRAHPSSSPEHTDETLSPELNAQNIALEKAQSVAVYYPDKWVLGVDTLVSVDNKVVGKAADVDQATTILKALSGRKHQVISGIALVKNQEKHVESVSTNIWFREFTEEEIAEYIASGIWKGKSGAFTIQGRGALFIEKIAGDYFNVVGLPIFTFGKMCKKIGIKI